MAMADLTAARLRELLDYSVVTGKFYWRVKPNRRIRVGSEAGAFSKIHGSFVIGVDGTHYLAHRLAWLHVQGEWPSAFIDHVNTNPGHNGWHNLRAADKVLNAENLRLPSPKKKSGLPLGVSIDNRDGAYRADIASRGKKIALGRFTDPMEAHAAYVRAKRALHGGCTI